MNNLKDKAIEKFRRKFVRSAENTIKIFQKLVDNQDYEWDHGESYKDKIISKLEE